MSYGVAVWCLDSAQSGRLARGANVVIQSCYRRLTTRRGSLRGGPNEQNFGVDLTSYIGSLSTEDTAAQLPGVIRGELLKDDRVADVDTTVVPITNPDKTVTFNIAIRIVLHDENDVFTLVLAVSAVTVQILGIT